jgi:ATP-dependent RNA helicase RhlE
LPQNIPVQTFSELNLSKQLLKALSDLGFETPTPIQAKAFPIIMSGRDAIAIAQTGTGKTFSYLLPLLRQLTFSEQRQPRILIVVPTRELVVQVVNEITKLTKYMSVRCLGVYGGVKTTDQKQQVYDGIDILVATPGRLMDLYLSRILQLNCIKKLVIDEVDEMLNLGFRPQLLQIMEALPAKRQNLLFSATLTEDVEKMITSYFHTPEYIEMVSRGTPLEKIIQQAYKVPNFYTKVNLLMSLLSTDTTISKALLFVKNKKVADNLFKALKPEFGTSIGIIHSNKSQSFRFDAVKKLQEGKHRVLIATDVIARGVDIADVTHVINFDLPNEPGVYIHRIGRTGRADKTGHAISFITKADHIHQLAIEKLMNLEIPILKIPAEVEISEELTPEEMPVKKDKNLNKNRRDKKQAPTKGTAFAEKKEKNKKVNLGGARRQESQRRKLEKSIQNRSKGKR